MRKAIVRRNDRFFMLRGIGLLCGFAFGEDLHDQAPQMLGTVSRHRVRRLILGKQVV